MMKPSIRLGKIAGIEVGVHYSLLLVLLFFSWNLANGFLPGLNPFWSTTTYWAVGFTAALLLFASVLVHELAHSVVARASGFEVEGITLFLLGGVSSFKAEAKGPRNEFVISAVGPAASLALAALLFVVYRMIGSEGAPSTPFGRVTAPLSVVETLLLYLWFINLALGIFNLLPAFPLDGGRILRAIIWASTGSVSLATRIAARGGQLVGILMIAWGAWQLLQFHELGGLFLVVVGLFLNGTANTARREVEVQSSIRSHRVEDAMQPDPPTIEPDLAVAAAVYGPLMRPGVRALPVCDGETLVGIISLSDIEGAPRHEWTSTRVRERMTRAPLWTLDLHDDLAHGLELLGEHSINQAPVLHEGRLVGLLSRADVIRFMHLHGKPDAGRGPFGRG